MSFLVVVGQGYVGLPIAMRAVDVGHRVVGFDVNAIRIGRLSSGDSYVEDVPDDELNEALASGRYCPTTDPSLCAGFEYAIITVPTPLRDGVPDLSYIEASAEMVGGALERGATVVLESTTYPGTTVELLIPILEARSGLKAGHDFHVGYSPERIDPGNRTWTLVNTPKVVSGIDPKSLEMVQALYGSLVSRTVEVSRTQEAEFVKLIENTFRHVNIALINELAMFAGDLNIDIWEAIDAASTKPFGFMRFAPGPGVGGHCLPVDPSYLSWRVRRRVGETFRFVELANDVNDHMPRYVVRRLTVALNRLQRSVKGSRILLLGIAYKPNTGDSRESPSLVVADLLLNLGADLTVADPHVDHESLPGRIQVVDVTEDALRFADVVVVLTDHDAFNWKLIQQHARLVLDTRHRTAGPNVEYL